VHVEKSPSLKLYQNTNTFYCFGCGAGTSVIDFTAAIQGITPLEAAKYLDTLYSLQLFNDKPLTAHERKKIEEDKKKRERERDTVNAFEEWEQQGYNTWAIYCRMLEHFKREYAPLTADDDFNPLFMEALHKLDYADYIYNEIFIHGNFEQKASFYQTHREELKRIEQRIREVGFTG
jgi:hypothetical protein